MLILFRIEMRKFLLYLLIFTCPLLSEGKVIVGSKSFSESLILSEMLSALLVQEGVTVEKKLNLNGTHITFEALKSGDIDVYPEYTGTGYSVILKKTQKTIKGQVLKTVRKSFQKQFGILWSNPVGFNNTYGLAVQKGDQRFTNIFALSQLKNVEGSILLGSTHEFVERVDGFSALAKIYELPFKESEVRTMSMGLLFQTIKEKKIDVTVVYETDGRVLSYDLRVLKDDLNFFPPYDAAFIYNQTKIETEPALTVAIKKMEGLISSSDMRAMNYQVDVMKKDPKQVALDFLINKSLIKKPEKISQTTPSGWTQFLNTKRDYFYKILWEHIFLSLVSIIIAIIVAVPIGIVLTRHNIFVGPVFSLINTIQTIPSIALLGALVPLMGIGKIPAIFALFLYALLPIVRNTFSGISGVDSEFVEVSKGVGLSSGQILWCVEIPLALPVIIAGIRTATVIVVATATLAGLVGGGGLGDAIFRGVAALDTRMILLGAVPSAMLALVADRVISIFERRIVSKGLA